MKRYVLHEPFNIYHFISSQWEHPVHTHTYFEIIFILKGKGKHLINGNSYPYRSGDVFLLGPADYHSFDIVTKTEFCYLRFNDPGKPDLKHPGLKWQEVFHSVLRIRYHAEGTVVKDPGEKEKLLQLLRVLRSEYENRHLPGFVSMRDSLMAVILSVLARNLREKDKPGLLANPVTIQEITSYIRMNIADPEKLSIPVMAERFNYASAYLSIFFKNHTGIALKSYIVQQRIKLVETRLLYSSLTLGAIASEFGFTDESHLCKQFRKVTGITPAQFRRK